MCNWYTNAGSYVLVGEGYNEEFEVKVGVTKDQYSARCSSSLCLNPGRTSMPIKFLNRVIHVYLFYLKLCLEIMVQLYNIIILVG